MSEVEEELRLAARVDVRVLISAEDDDLREMCARLIHEGSSRRLGPFVTQHGSTLDGAATGNALSGCGFERARGGTLFIDDVTQLGVSSQVQLCSWLEEHVTPEGLSVDGPRSSVRIIAGADGQLDHERRSGRFSESLFYRLNLLHINLLRSGSRATTGPTAAVVMSTSNSASA